jgi:hypothetical protein
MTVSVESMAEIATLAALMENRNAYAVLAAGADGKKLSAAARLSEVSRNGRRPFWTKKDDAFLKKNLLTLTAEELAQKLGRSPTAVKLRRKRLGLASITSQVGLSAHVVGLMLGFDNGKEVGQLVSGGIMPGRRAPLGNNRFSIDRDQLIRWCVNPANWVYFNPEKVNDPEIRRLLNLRKERWNDEWWSTMQVAKYYRISQSEVTRHCREGRIPCRRPAGGLRGYRILKSVAINLPFWNLKGFGHWNDATEEFCILAAAVGYPHRQIDRMAGWPIRRAGQHLYHLRKSGKLKAAVERLNLPVLVREDGASWADWREHKNRFPAITESAERLVEGREINPSQRFLMLSVMATWLEWFSSPDDDKAQENIRRLRFSVTAKAGVLQMWVRQLEGQGIWPFDKENLL